LARPDSFDVNYFMVRKKAPSCDWTPARGKNKTNQAKKPAATPKTRLMKHGADFSWSGVKTERYKQDDGTWAEVIRRTLVGDRGERAKFHLRYFEVAPGGHTTFERHSHEHVVVGVRGKGVCMVKRRRYDINLLDVIYIPPEAPHRISNPYRKPFGFFCIVDAKRDRPKPIG
jgi:ribulose-bisphosphate carboxylase large chain